MDPEIAMSSPGVLGSIGDTPLIRLPSPAEEEDAEIWAKWEGANPTGSMKDRMALSMVEGAAKRGDLPPGGRVVEYTGGSTGSSLAMVCAAKGYSAHLVSSDAFAEEKLRTMRAFGATLDIIPSENREITAELIRAMIDRAGELAQEPGTFWTDQFNNVDNRRAYHAMAEEILRNLPGHLDAFVTVAGTGGCFSGNVEVFKQEDDPPKCVAVQPATHKNLSGGPVGPHRIEGIGPGFVPKIMRMDLVDEILSVANEDANETARLLAAKAGVFGGISSGANVFAAQEVAHELGPGHRVVTVLVDSGLKYLGQEPYF
ncbi:MAG: PLP-dependent cysteine synthase family protein [Thermoplasmata archaeon]